MKRKFKNLSKKQVLKIETKWPETAGFYNEITSIEEFINYLRWVMDEMDDIALKIKLKELLWSDNFKEFIFYYLADEHHFSETKRHVYKSFSYKFFSEDYIEDKLNKYLSGYESYFPEIMTKKIPDCKIQEIFLDENKATRFIALYRGKFSKIRIKRTFSNSENGSFFMNQFYKTTLKKEHVPVIESLIADGVLETDDLECFYALKVLKKINPATNFTELLKKNIESVGDTTRRPVFIDSDALKNTFYLFQSGFEKNIERIFAYSIDFNVNKAEYRKYYKFLQENTDHKELQEFVRKKYFESLITSDERKPSQIFEILLIIEPVLDTSEKIYNIITKMSDSLGNYYGSNNSYMYSIFHKMGATFYSKEDDVFYKKTVEKLRNMAEKLSNEDKTLLFLNKGDAASVLFSNN